MNERHTAGVLAATAAAVFGCGRGEPPRPSGERVRPTKTANPSGERAAAPGGAGPGAPAAEPRPAGGAVTTGARFDAPLSGAPAAVPGAGCARIGAAARLFAQTPAGPPAAVETPAGLAVAFTVGEGPERKLVVGLGERRFTVVSPAAPGAHTVAPPALARFADDLAVVATERSERGPELRWWLFDGRLAARAEGRLASRVDYRFAPAAIAIGDRLLVAYTAAPGGRGPDASTNRVYTITLRADGQAEAPPRLVSPPSSNGAAPSAARWGQGALVLWIDPRLGPSPMYMAHYDAAAAMKGVDVLAPVGSVLAPATTLATDRDGARLFGATCVMGSLGVSFAAALVAECSSNRVLYGPAPLSRTHRGPVRISAAAIDRGFAVAEDAEQRITVRAIDPNGRSRGAIALLGIGTYPALVAPGAEGSGSALRVVFRRNSMIWGAAVGCRAGPEP